MRSLNQRRDSIIHFEELESRLLLDGASVVDSSMPQRIDTSQIPSITVSKEGVRAIGAFSTTAGYAAHGCKTDYGVKGAVTTGVVGAHTLTWNANGTWTCLGIASGTWSTDASGNILVDFSNTDVQNLVNQSLGVTSLYNTRPRECTVKYSAPTAENEGSIAFKISYRTHTWIGVEEGHIQGAYVAKYTIPCSAQPDDLEHNAVGQIKLKDNARGPNGERSQYNRITAGTLRWNKNGTFTYGTMIQNGTWARDPDGNYVVNMSLADVQRIFEAMKTDPAAIVVNTREVIGCKARVSASKVDSLQIKLNIVVDVPGWGQYGQNVAGQIAIKLVGI